FVPLVPPVVIPNDLEQPDGPCIAMTVDPGIGGNEEGGTPVAGEDNTPPEEESKTRQTRRLLRVINASKEKVTVYVQYLTQDEDGNWVWVPGEPGSDEAVSYELEPGEAADLADDGWPINASKVRIWAQGESTKWEKFKD